MKRMQRLWTTCYLLSQVCNQLHFLLLHHHLNHYFVSLYVYSFHELLCWRVIGVKHDEMPNGILLEVSFMPKAVSIFEVSDEDFTEQECEDLPQKVNTGLLPKLTVWIASRLANLEIQIERANLRGRNKQYPS